MRLGNLDLVQNEFEIGLKIGNHWPLPCLSDGIGIDPAI